MEVEIMQTVIFVLIGIILGTLIGVLYKIDKLQKAMNELKGIVEK
jgi:hypothetical protein